MNKLNCQFHCYKKEIKEITKPREIKKIKLVVFDMDGVLTDIISSWKYMHDYFNTSNEESVNLYLKGKIDDLEFIKRDADLWVEEGLPIKRQRLEEILGQVPIMKGAPGCIDFLKSNKIKTAIVSAGLDVLAERVKKNLGIDYSYSNGVEIDSDGRLNGVGKLEVKLTGKNQVVADLAKDLDIASNNIVAVGNSCFDIPMFEASGLGIAFNPGDECVKKAADYTIMQKDLSKLTNLLSEFQN